MGNRYKRLLSTVLVIVAMLALVPSIGRAQEFGVVESAETIDRGTFKLRVNPMFVFGRDGADDDAGVAGHLGYGFTDRFDAEVGVALYDGMRFFARASTRRFESTARARSRPVDLAAWWTPRMLGATVRKR